MNKINVRCLLNLNNNIIIGTENGTIRLWNTNKQRIKTLNCKYQTSLKCLILLSNGNLAADDCLNETINIIDPKTGDLIQTIENKDRINCLINLKQQQQQDNNNTTTIIIIVSGHENGQIKLFNAITCKQIKILEEHTGWITCLVSLNDGTLVSSSTDRTIKLWNISTGNVIKTLINGHNHWINCLTVLNNGILVSGSLDKTIKLWNTHTGEVIQTLHGHTGWITCLNVLPNSSSSSNNVLVSCSEDNTIRLWNTNNGQLIKTLKEEEESILSLLVLNDNKIITGHKNDKIKIWDINSNLSEILDNEDIIKNNNISIINNNYKEEEEIERLKESKQGVNSLCLLNDDNCTLVTSSSNKSNIKFWNYKTGELIRTLNS